jgi:glycosyltransferase involved in cell wall biosynthesis
MIVANEASRIEPALKSVQWADEIVIIDGFSRDGTVEICRRYTDRVFQYPWEGFARQRQHSLEHATHSWIFSIDADEVVTEALREEILAIVRLDERACAGYRVPRKTKYLGRWIEHSGWFPDYQTRLFQKSKVTVAPRLVHEGFEVTGEIRKLNGILLHHAFDSIAQHLAKINRYTSLDAHQKIVQLQGRRVRWFHLIFNPLSKFLRMFISNQGFRDGFQGFILALLSAFATLLVYAKVWELQHPLNEVSDEIS